MDVFVLDELLRRTTLIDQYESFIWTERYSAWGDFELVVRADRGMRNALPIGARLAILKSWRVMVVENVEDKVNDDGIAVLVISGRSLEVVLEDRAAMPPFGTTGLEDSIKWELTGTPGGIARNIFKIICEDGTLSPNDVIPFYTPGPLLPAGTIPEPSDEVIISLDPDTVYNSIKKICDIYNLGFRLLRNQDESQIHFEVYTGHDRTTLQTVHPAVVFSPGLDNLSNTAAFSSTAGFKNVAYVFGKYRGKYVYAEGVDNTIAVGFDRHVLIVKVTDLEPVFEVPEGSPPETEPTPEAIAAGWAAYDAALIQRGKEALAEHRPIMAFDGEIPQSSSYVYGKDYELGDLVETRSSDGLATNMRVTEQIFVSDADGVKSYPTLTIDQLITPGSWYSGYGNQVWDDANEMWIEV